MRAMLNSVESQIQSCVKGGKPESSTGQHRLRRLNTLTKIVTENSSIRCNSEHIKIPVQWIHKNMVQLMRS